MFTEMNNFCQKQFSKIHHTVMSHLTQMTAYSMTFVKNFKKIKMPKNVIKCKFMP